MKTSLQSFLDTVFKQDILKILAIGIPLLFTLTFSYYPVIKACLLSLYAGRGDMLTFSGFDNYARLTTDSTFLIALGNTLSFSLVQTPLMILLSIIVALALVKVSDKLSPIFTVIIFLPYVVSPVVYSIFFKFLFLEDGVVNNLLIAIGWIQSPINWFLDPYYAKIIILIACTWAWSGYFILLLVTALRRINPSMIEAAIVDGVSPLKIFTQIKLPTVLPMIFFCLIIGFGGAMQIFAETMIITAGGPANQTLSLIQYVYMISFKYFPQFGYASTISIITILIGALLIYIQLVISDLYETRK
jgi:lactose/L-arabinose transport system permease protein